MLNEEDFNRQLKAKLLEMLSWFHDFCVGNGIRYYVIDGTMLGAARHRGFIPWDDDIDVGVPRRDYERLAKLLRENPDGRYFLETPHSPAREFFWPWSKLYDTATTLKEHAKINITRGIYIDVFPLDGIGHTEDEARQNYKKIDRLFSLCMLRGVAPKPERKFYKNAAVVLAQLIPGFIINDKQLQLKVDEACREHDYDEYEFIGSLVSFWRFREVMDKTIIGNPTPYKFESITVLGVEKYDEYLTHLYGDWRTPPPAEKQVSRHDNIECDLNKPYLTGDDK